MRFLSLVNSAATVIHPWKGPRQIYRRVRLLANAFKHRAAIGMWLDAGDLGGMRASLIVRPQMIGIVEWPYLHKDWEVLRRFEAVLGHYTELQCLPWLRIGVTETRMIADLTDLLPGLRIVLDRPEWFQREGELTLNLFVEDTRVYSLAFIFGHESGRRIAFIGAMQGRNLDNIESIYKDITKKCYGVRPRDLLATIFQMLAVAAGVQRVLAVNEECRHHKHPYFGNKASSTQSASYDDIWTDRGGQPDSDGFFELPLAPTVRQDSDIPAHKRSMYRKRYALLDRIRADIDRIAGECPESRITSQTGTAQAVGVKPTTS